MASMMDEMAKTLARRRAAVSILNLIQKNTITFIKFER